MNTARRMQFIDWLLLQEGRPYIYRAKGEPITLPDGSKVPAYDCSGLVTCGFQAVGLPGWDKHATLYTNAQKLFDELPDTMDPRPGDLAFYGRDAAHVDHVMVWMGDGRVYGASGGNSDTTKPTKGAEVHWKNTVRYRPDFLGFRTSPFPDGEPWTPPTPAV